MTSGYSMEHITYPTALGRSRGTRMRAQAALGPPQPDPLASCTHLLASLMSAMAMTILLRRKMSSKMMISSRMLRIITKGRRHGGGSEGGESSSCLGSPLPPRPLWGQHWWDWDSLKAIQVCRKCKYTRRSVWKPRSAREMSEPASPRSRAYSM